jgi:hypothetical protein
MSLSALLVPSRPRVVALLQEVVWSLPEVAVAQALWGQGLVSPFGLEETSAVVGAASLSAADRLVLVGGGPGGVARRIVEACGVRVLAYEADPLLGLLGGAGAFSAVRPDFGRLGADAALVMNIGCEARLADVLAAVMLALRPGGRVVVLASVAAPEAVMRCLRCLRCVVESYEDRSDARSRAVIDGWARLAAQLGGPGVASWPRAARQGLMRQAEAWMEEVARLRRGALWHLRVSARRLGAEGDCPETDTLLDSGSMADYHPRLISA